MPQAYQHPRWNLATLKPFRYFFLPRAKPATPSAAHKKQYKPPSDFHAMEEKWVELAGRITQALRPFPEAFAAYRSIVEEFYYCMRTSPPIEESPA